MMEWGGVVRKQVLNTATSVVSEEEEEEEETEGLLKDDWGLMKPLLASATVFTHPE